MKSLISAKRIFNFSSNLEGYNFEGGCAFLFWSITSKTSSFRLIKYPNMERVNVNYHSKLIIDSIMSGKMDFKNQYAGAELAVHLKLATH